MSDGLNGIKLPTEADVSAAFVTPGGITLSVMGLGHPDKVYVEASAYGLEESGFGLTVLTGSHEVIVKEITTYRRIPVGNPAVCDREEVLGFLTSAGAAPVAII